MSSDRIVTCLGSFAEILSDPGGYEPERLKSLSRNVPDLISSFIEAILSSDEDVMQEKLVELADYATHVNSFQAWFNLGFLAQRLFFHQAAIEYYEKSASLARAQGDDENVSRVLFSLGSLYGEEEDWNRACECYEKALQALQRLRKILSYAADFGKSRQHISPARRVSSGRQLLFSGPGCTRL